MRLIQRTRKTKLPPNTLCVTRVHRSGAFPYKYGNPFKIGDSYEDLSGWHRINDNKTAIWLFREWIWRDEQLPLREEFIAECKANGIKNLACWCPLDKPCHRTNWGEVWERMK